MPATVAGFNIPRNRIGNKLEGDPSDLESPFHGDDNFGLLHLDAIDDSETSESSLELGGNLFPLTGTKMLSSISGNEEDIPISDLGDLEEDVDDLVPYTRLTIDNTLALQAALGRIYIPIDESVPFTSHQSVGASTETACSISDVSDDLGRELAFYSQCLEAAQLGRAKLLAQNVPFSRPKDYFAEMLKNDSHMENVKGKLVDELSANKAAAEIRKLRDLKKFGKRLQMAKLQQRQKAKRETLDQIKTLKRKRKESGVELDVDEKRIFDVSLDGARKNPQRSGTINHNDGDRKRISNRQRKNEKYGFGGRKRHVKSGDAMSSGDLSSFDAKRMKADSAKWSGQRNKAAHSRPGNARRRGLGAR